MNNMSTGLKIFSTVCFIILLASCGGGGGSSGSSNNNGSDLTACLNFRAPPPPTLNYAGDTSAATLDETNALPMVARTMLLMLQLGKVIPALPQDEAVNQESCFSNQTAGGITLIQTNESGWSDYQYNNYAYYSEYKITGTAYATFSSVSSNNLQVNETISLTNFHFTIPSDMDITVNGTINVTVARVNPTSPFNISTPVTANVVIVDNLNHTTTWAKNYQYSDTTSGQPTESVYVSRTLSGRIYDSQLGYADIQTVTPISYELTSSGSMPAQVVGNGGPIRLSAQQPEDLYLTPLNGTLFSIALDQAGNGFMDESVRINQSDLQPDTTPWPNLVGPVPMAAVDSQSSSPPVTGQVLGLDGQRSYSPSGNFITYSWKETFAPAGSVAVLENSQSAMPAFIPDVTGDYRFQLTVSDGVNSNTDEIVVTVANSPDPSLAATYTNMTGPDLQDHVGQTVTLDGRASVGGIAWTLIPPPGSNAQLSDQSDDPLRPQFTPDVPGFYLAILETYLSSTSNIGIIPRQVIAVDTGMAFHKAVMLIRGNNNPFLRFVVGDFNNDGTPDIAVVNGININSGLTIYYGTQAGEFAVPVNITLPSGGNFTYIEAKDVNNDGLTDIEIGGSGTYVLLQQSDGAMSSPQQIAANSTCGSLLFAVGPWKSAITNSIYTVGANCVDIYNSVSSTQFVSSGTYTLDELDPVPLAQIANVTGDNLADILVFNGSSALDVFAGQSDGSFVKQDSYQITGDTSYKFIVGDFNHDGSQDVAAPAGNSIDVLLQNVSGGFASGDQYPVLSSTGLWTGGLTDGDINNDGLMDLVIQHMGYQFPDFYSPYDASAIWYAGLLLQNNNQIFNSELLFPFYATQIPSAPQPISTQIIDMNSDGLPDIVMSDNYGDLIILYQKPYN